MPKAPVVTAEKLIKVLAKKGFVFERQKGSHVRLSRQSDKKQVTLPVHPGRPLPRRVLESILDVAGISHEELVELL
ncbi:hypothetical protein IX51_08805 [uncultured archaeon]|nr:hypothetical protein IX51_08805 [uncultured archaeon]